MQSDEDLLDPYIDAYLQQQQQQQQTTWGFVGSSPENGLPQVPATSADARMPFKPPQPQHGMPTHPGSSSYAAYRQPPVPPRPSATQLKQPQQQQFMGFGSPGSQMPYQQQQQQGQQGFDGYEGCVGKRHTRITHQKRSDEEYTSGDDQEQAGDHDFSEESESPPKGKAAAASGGRKRKRSSTKARPTQGGVRQQHRGRGVRSSLAKAATGAAADALQAAKRIACKPNSRHAAAAAAAAAASLQQAASAEDGSADDNDQQLGESDTGDEEEGGGGGNVKQRWLLVEDEYWVDHLVAHILSTGSDTGIMWKQFCEQAVAQEKLKQRNYPNAISTRKRGFYAAYKIIAHCKTETGTQPFYTLTKHEQKALLKGGSDGGRAKQVPYLPESIYDKLSGVLDGDAMVLPHVKLSVGSAAKPTLEVLDEETGTHKAQDLLSRFDHNRHAKKQGGQTGGAAAAAALALGKLAEVRKESSSSRDAVERDKVEIMRINGQTIAAGISWGLGMSSFISNHPELSDTQALDFLERGQQRQNKLALQQAATFAAEADKAAAARAAANAAASKRAAGASTAHSPAAAGDAATEVAPGGAAAAGEPAGGTGAAAGTHAAGASPSGTTTAAGGDAAPGAATEVVAADETAGGAANAAAESTEQPQQHQPQPDRGGLRFV